MPPLATADPSPPPPATGPLGPVPLLLAAVAVGWSGVIVASRGHLSGYGLAVVATVLLGVALWRGQRIASARNAGLVSAVNAAAARNRELELLRTLAGTMLRVRTRDELFEEIVAVAADLLDAGGAALFLLVEEGRFIRVVAGRGSMGLVKGALLPVDGSLAGWVVTHQEAVVSNALAEDPRLHPLPEVAGQVRQGLFCPLQSSGITLGVLAAFDRNGGDIAFTGQDTQALQTLADQAAFGLDRVSVLEESARSQQALAAKNRELERATRLKNMFLANMSHELRTPLNAIIGFSELLLTGQMGDLDTQQREFLESIARNGTHLLGLINNVLDLSKIEAGRMTQTLTRVDLRGLIAAAVVDTSSLRSAKRQRCTLDVDTLPPFIVADDQRVRQILLNLLSNASKFTGEEGEITIRGANTRAPLNAPADRSGDHRRMMEREAVWVAVSDNGIGIRAEDQTRLFTAFTQVDTSASRLTQGTGLGLALCKQFVEMHGGSIGVESLHGQGSTFWFLLPVDGPIRRRGLALAAETPA